MEYQEGSAWDAAFGFSFFLFSTSEITREFWSKLFALLEIVPCFRETFRVASAMQVFASAKACFRDSLPRPPPATLFFCFRDQFARSTFCWAFNCQYGFPPSARWSSTLEMARCRESFESADLGLAMAMAMPRKKWEKWCHLLSHKGISFVCFEIWIGSTYFF